MAVSSGSNKPMYEIVKDISHAKQFVRIAPEAGTYPDTNYQAYFVLNVYYRIFEGNWYSELGQQTKNAIKEFFYPESKEWKLSVW